MTNYPISEELRKKVHDLTAKCIHLYGEMHADQMEQAILALFHSTRLSHESDHWNYQRLINLEIKGIEDYQEMREAAALTEERVLAFINQLSPWNLKTSGASILQMYVNKQLTQSTKQEEKK